MNGAPARGKGGAIEDPRLPYLGALLDAVAMRFILQDGLSIAPAIVRLRILSRRYRPLRGCAVSYEAIDRNGCRHLLAAEVTAGVDSLRMWRFPDDPAISGLRTVRCGAAGSFEPTMVVADATGARIQPMRVLRYEPRKHAVLAASTDTVGQRCVAKILRPDAAWRARTAWASVCDRLAHGSATLQCPALLGFDDRAGAIWLQWRDGERFEVAARTLGLDAVCRLAAGSLAGLHQADIDVPGRPDAATFKQETLKRCAVLAAAYPACAESLLALRARIAERLDDSPCSEVTPVHGDFNPSQLLIEDGRGVMLDLDTVGRGDPLEDVAHFVAGLHRLPVSIGAVDAAAEQFIDGYERAMRRKLSRRRLHDLIAAVLVYRTAYKVLRRLLPNGADSVAWCASLAMQYLNN